MSTSPPGDADEEFELVEDVTPQDVHELINRLAFRQIRFVDSSGHTPPGDLAPVADIGIRFDPPRMRVEDDTVSLWFEHRVRCLDEAGDEVATINTGLTIDFTLTAGPAPSLHLVSTFADADALFMVWPYIREAVHTMSVRLGLDPIMLSVLTRNTFPYTLEPDEDADVPAEAFTVHFHGGPLDGTRRELGVADPPMDLYLVEDEEGELMREISIEPVKPGEAYPTVPDSHYVLRDGPIAGGLHYDWAP